MTEAVAIGTFDGVHLGHQRVIEAAVETGLPVRVLTFHPHPRVVLGNFVESIATLERRLELLAELGVAETTVLDFTRRGRAAGAGGVRPHPARRRCRRRRRRGLPLRPEAVAAISSCSSGSATRCGRCRCSKASRRPRSGDGCTQARWRRLRSCSAGRRSWTGSSSPATSVAARSATRPRTSRSIRRCSCPSTGSTREPSLGHRAAISIGTNPHYGGEERRIEPYLLDFEGDLYGRRLIVELWERLRDEQVFESEQELIDQIARDVEATRGAVRPA